MPRQSLDDPRSIGRSVAAPLALFGLIMFVVGVVRMVSGEDQSLVVVLGGIFLLVGAVLAYRLGERAASRDTAGEVSSRQRPRAPRP